MKIFICILFLAFNVSASSYSQTVSLETSKAPLREVLQQVRKQTGYYFIFQSALLNDAKPVTVNLKNAELKAVLEMIFKEQPFQYEFKDKGILVKRKSNAEKNILQKVSDFFSVITVRGKVTDESGTPLPGASVKAGSKATVTDSNGEFVLTGVDEGTAVEVSYLGYKSATIAASTEFMNVQLQLNVGELRETVVKGYYNTTRELNTGSVSVVKNSDLVKNTTGDAVLALQGRASGLFIQQRSANAGGGVVVKLRGQNSIANGNNPLYVIDGVPFNSNNLAPSSNAAGAAAILSPFATLNVDNIDRIEILKDADATAIYGSRGANGVILITTKKGTTGKTRLNANVYTGAGKVANRLDLMGTQEYLNMRRQALANDGITGPPTDKDLNGAYGDVNKYTDWQAVMMGGTAHLTDANASISGGSEKTQFMVGGGYRHESSVFPGNYKDAKASFTGNVNHVDGKVKANFSFSYLNDNNQLAPENYARNILLSPNAPDLYNADGKLNWQNSAWFNPLWSTTQHPKTITDNLNTSLNLGYDIIQGLSATVRGGFSDVKTHFTIPNAYLDYDPAVPILPEYRDHSYGDSRIRTYIIEPGVNYTRNIDQGKLEALVGASFQQTDQNALYGYASGFSSASLIDNLAAASSKSITTFIDNRYRYSAIYGRLAYSYQEKYLINLTGRRDASSRFGPGKQFANFGAVGAAWIFSKEKFIESALSFISFGKLRTSYGLTGNDQTADYGFLSTYTPGSLSYQGVNTVNPTSLTNPKFGWETVKKLEAAIELGFLKDRILFNAGWYRNRTGNQLVGYALPGITGFTSVQANLPAVIQNTGAEFDFTAHAFDMKDFKWSISGNLSIPRNKLVSYPNIESSSYSSRYIVGQPLFITFLYHYIGIDQTKGSYTFEDKDNSGTITFQNDRSPNFVGQKYFGGVNNSFTYKGFQLDVFLQFVKQNGYKFSPNLPGSFSDNIANQPRSVIGEQDRGEIQKFTQNLSGDAANAYFLYAESDALLTDASFIRLKNLSLSWSVPKKYAEIMKLGTARFYIQGQNLFTITKYKGLDPEYLSGTRGAQVSLPPLRMITAGIQVSL